MSQIKILLVDDIRETRSNVKRLLQFESDITVIGEASDGQEAIRQAELLHPDIILMDINMPGMDGLLATEAINLNFPSISIIMLSVQGEPEYLKRAMMAGAREFLTKPFTSDDLVNTIRRAHNLEKKRQNQRGQTPRLSITKSEPQVITVFSTKGGVGKTTIVTNLALSLYQETRAKIVILDLDLQFGDVAVMLNLNPKHTIVDLIQGQEGFEAEIISRHLVSHLGIKILASPPRPEHAELITSEHIEKIITGLKEQFDYILIDTPACFNETTLAALDLTNRLLLVTTLDLPTIKNVKLSLEVLDSLHHSEKIHLLLNRSSSEVGIKFEDIEKALSYRISAEIVSEGKLVISSVNRGMPFVLSHPNTRISQNIKQLAVSLKDRQSPVKNIATVKRSLVGRLIGSLN